MTKIETPKNSVNFLKNKKFSPPDLSEPVAGAIPGQKKGLWLCFFIIGFIFLLATVAVHNFNTANQANPDSFANKLMPKKFGFFQSVKNFLFSSDDVMLGQKEDRVNILLLGIGGTGHDGPYLSDTNIIASIRPSTREVALISIPRDLGVRIENYGIYKINHADAFGENKDPGRGGDYARQIFAETFALDIPYYIRVDFQTFSEIIDAIGGVTVDVKRPFVDQSYPAANFAYQTVSFEQGPQNMDGDTALKFARSRHGTNGESSDFARSRRQQQILEAVKEKVMSFGTLANPLKLQKIWDSAANNIATNLEAGQMLYLLDLIKDVDSQKIKNVVLDSSSEGYLYSYMSDSGAYLLGPKSGNFDEINNIIKNVFDPNYTPPVPPAIPQITYTAAVATDTAPTTATPAVIPVDSVLIEIQNGTWIGGLASRYQSRLAEQGFSVLTIGNSEERPMATTTIYVLDPAVPNESVERLSDLVGGQIELGLPDWLAEKTPADPDNPVTDAGYHPLTDILIILGTDANR